MGSDDRPMSEKIAADLRAQIAAGLIPPGTKLESIPSMAKRLGVSPTPIQNAWDMLKAEKYLVSHPGKGVFVRDRNPFVVDTAAYYDPVSRGVTYKLLEVAEVQAPADVAEALGEATAALRRRRTDRDGEPVELSWSYYPMSLVAGTPLTKRGKIPGGAPRVLAELGYPEREFVDRVSVRPPTPEEAESLDVPRGVPVLRQFRVVYSDNARPVEVSVIVKPGHLYELKYRQIIPSE